MKTHLGLVWQATLRIVLATLALLPFGCSAKMRQSPPTPSEASSANSPKPYTQASVWETEPVDLGTIIRSNRPKHYIGSYRSKDQSYSLAFYLGIEQWENGKRTTHRYQRWWFNCSFPDIVTHARQTRCSIERLVIDRGLGTTPHVSQHDHTKGDNSLQVKSAEWEAGKIDLTMMFDDKNTADLALRFKKAGSGLYLTSFKGAGIANSIVEDSEPSVVEYRVPSYTYTLNVPVPIEGIDDAGLKYWDEMFAALDERDQMEWNRLDASQVFSAEFDKAGPGIRERFNKLYPHVDLEAIEKGKGKLTDDENTSLERITKEVVIELMSKQVDQANFSKPGRKRIVAYLNWSLGQMPRRH